ncbi:MAG TPA: hypothetical protein VJ730_05840 [Nitrososphaera sp.]|jgi:hypothetical protein|nr:hypothetical protein [Nitrososphaera sp.]
MIFDVIVSLSGKIFNDSYRVLDQYLVTNFFAFIKGFEIAIFMTVAVIFLLITLGIAIRQLKRLPKSYFIVVFDIDGRKTTVDGLRQIFSTYEAAESYARFYRKMYDSQYTFKVIGSKERATYDTSRISKIA